MRTLEMIKKLLESKEGYYVCDREGHHSIKCRYENGNIVFSTNSGNDEVSIPEDALWEEIVWSTIPIDEIQPIREVFMKKE